MLCFLNHFKDSVIIPFNTFFWFRCSVTKIFATCQDKTMMQKIPRKPLILIVFCWAVIHKDNAYISLYNYNVGKVPDFQKEILFI